MQGWLEWMCYFRPEDRISTVKPRNRQQLNNTRECLQKRILLRVGHLERMEENP